VAKPKPQTGSLIWLAAVTALLGVGAFFLWTQDTRRGGQAPEYSVTRNDDRGAAILYRLYERSGLKPDIWDADLAQLREPGLLILLAPEKQQKLLGQVAGTEGDILPHEIQALDEWVKQGNVAVVMGAEENSLFNALGLMADAPEDKGASGAPAVPTQPSLLARGVKSIETMSPFGFKYGRKKNPEMEGVEDLPGPIPPIPAEQWLELFAKKDGGRSVPQVVSAARGKGLYVAMNDAVPAGNLGLTMGDNAQFMLNMASLRPPGGKIWFDEFHKRPVERNLVGYLRERSLAPALLYLLLLAGLYFWRTGVPFGAPVPLVRDRRRDSVEYVRAVAALYRNSGMAREALGTIVTDFRRRLTGALRMDGLTDLDEVGRRYERRTGRPAIEARQILVETEAALAREKLDDAEALQFCARLSQLDQALHQKPPQADRRSPGK